MCFNAFFFYVKGGHSPMGHVLQGLSVWGEHLSLHHQAAPVDSHVRLASSVLQEHIYQNHAQKDPSGTYPAIFLIIIIEISF